MSCSLGLVVVSNLFGHKKGPLFSEGALSIERRQLLEAYFRTSIKETTRIWINRVITITTQVEWR
jgi:hypothetical protein